MPIWKRLLREPLVHFVLLGAAFFVWFDWRGAGPESNRIVVATGTIQHLAAGFTRTWNRPPTEAELKGLVDDWVREEIATREAMAMGLDKDDTILRRRLRQKLEFLAEDILEAAPPTDAELESWLAEHPDRFRIEPRVAFRQVYVSRDRHGEEAEAVARTLLARLEQEGPEARIQELGDSLMLPNEMELASESEVERLFGRRFAEGVIETEPGDWSGPIESGFGLHLVLVRERVEGRLPELAAVRPAVERELLAERRKRQLEAMYERLLEKYTVTIERPQQAEAGSATPVTARTQ